MFIHSVVWLTDAELKTQIETYKNRPTGRTKKKQKKKQLFLKLPSEVVTLCFALPKVACGSSVLFPLDVGLQSLIHTVPG